MEEYNKTVSKGLIWNSIQQVFNIGLNFVALMILARILSPKDYGLYGILMIFVSISEGFADSGMGGYLVKKQNASEIYYDTLFVYNICISLFFYLCMFIGAPYIASIYDNADVTNALRVLGIVVLIYAFSITQNTRLLKNMQFRTMAIVSIISGICGLSVAILLAHSGVGYWALISQQIAYALISSILVIIINKKIPSFCFNFGVFKEQFSFGFYLFLSSMIKSFTDNIGNNFIGKVFGFKSTGMYLQANKIQNYPVSLMSNVIDRTFFPIFSKFNSDLSRLDRESRKLRHLIYSILFPCFTLLLVFSKETVLIILGEQWSEVTPLLNIFLIAPFFITVKSMNRNILKSLGVTSKILWTEVVSVVILFIGLFIAVLCESMEGTVWAFIVSQIVAAIISAYFIRSTTGWSFTAQVFDFLTYIPIVLIPYTVTMVFSDSLLQRILFVVSLLIIVAGIYIMLGNQSYTYMYKKITSTIKIKTK